MQKRLRDRNDWFLSKGWHVLRFHASQCHADSDDIADEIISYSEKMKKSHADVLVKVFGDVWQRMEAQERGRSTSF